MNTYLLDDLIDNLLHKSGNKVVDDFIKYTQIKGYANEVVDDFIYTLMEFVPYNQFKYIKFIAEGGFSKVYKATWIDGYIQSCNKMYFKRSGPITVALKKLNNSENITSRELNEVHITLIAI